MLNKFVIAKPSSDGTTEYWSGTSSVASWGSLNGAKQFNSEISAMKAFCDSPKFTGKVSKEFSAAVTPACRRQGVIEVLVLKIEVTPVKKFVISERNFPL
jgi:hypothetical protein